MSTPDRLRPPPATRREIFGWAMFDFANSSYTTIVVTVVFSVYFTRVVAPGDRADALWGLGITVSNVLVVLSAPIVGAVADDSGRKKLFLLWTYLFCVMGTAALWYAQPGRVALALALFVVSNVAFSMGENLAGAFLPEIATAENIGKVSGFGWGLGYFGGLLSLVLLDWAVLPEKIDVAGAPAVRWAMVVTAAFFLVAALPTFLLLRERAERGPSRSLVGYATIGFKRLARTGRSVAHFRELVRFLTVFFIYSCGLMTVIAFASIYAERTLGFTVAELVNVFIVVQFASAGGAFLFGWVQDRIGAVHTIRVTLVLWILVCALAYATSSKNVFYGVILLAGLGIGSLQSASRGLVGLFSPPSKSAEFFGFWGLAGKGAYALGPLVFGWISYGTGSQRVAMLSTAAFFVVGLAGMFFVDEERGREAARRWSEARS